MLSFREVRETQPNAINNAANNVGRGVALVEAMTLNRRVVGSTPDPAVT